MATDLIVGRPDASEHPPFHTNYISLVPGADILPTLASQIEDTLSLLRSIPAEKGDYRYAPGKWTIRDCVGHMVDTERILTYRALRFSRGDQTTLPGFEQDDYVANAPYPRVPLADIIEEFADVRRASLWLFRNLDETAWNRRGMTGMGEVSVRGLAYIVAGHELNHTGILRDRYLE